jgi:hypothetical protein
MKSGKFKKIVKCLNSLGLNQILMYADVNLLGKNLNTTENKAAILLQT